MSATDYIIRYASIGLIILVLAIIIVAGQTGAILGLLLLPPALLYVFLIFRYPAAGIYSCLLFAWTANGLSRYVDLPLGISIDLLLVLTVAAICFQMLKNRQWNEWQNILMLVIGLWSVYCLLQLFNPEAVSYTAWLYAVRSPALYPLLTLMIGLVYFQKTSRVNQFLITWLVFSVIAALYSFNQFFIGLDEAEKRWLMDNASTHLLYGNLRVFSFYSDAAQFGAAMAHTALAAVILSLGRVSVRRRLLYLVCALICGYAMALSGTRGTVYLLGGGAISYLLLCRNWKVFLIGFTVAGLLFGLLKFTYVGQSNYQIQRMRSAFNMNDPSFQVRIKNQLKLQEYLETRPFGGGIGSAGYWGLRFSPDTFLARTPLDSWYVKIWAETGIIGLVLYLGITLFILGWLAIRIWNAPPSENRQLALALYAGLVGISVANYGNQVLGQMPTALLFYLSIAAIYTRTRAEKSPAPPALPSSAIPAKRLASPA